MNVKQHDLITAIGKAMDARPVRAKVTVEIDGKVTTLAKASEYADTRVRGLPDNPEGNA